MDISKILTSDSIKAICPGARSDIIESLLTDADKHFPPAGIDDEVKLAHFIAQIATESGGLSRLDENLNYATPKRLQDVFGTTRFPTLAVAKQYVKQPEKLANFVYAKRLGNGNAASGDGWAYRGSGLIQLTGRDNFRKVGKLIGIAIEAQPELARQADSALEIALGYWIKNTISAVADKDTDKAVEAVTKKINPPMVGIKERKAYFKKALKIFRQLAKSADPAPIKAAAPSTKSFAPAAAPKAIGKTLSGPSWVAQFPTSRSIVDLAAPFSKKLGAFVEAMRAAGAAVKVSATVRPKQRAYLMHWSWQISKGGFDPSKVPPMTGVAVEWVHSTLAKSRKAARDMVAGYGIVFKPALNSKHTEGLAIDMTISWSGSLKIKQQDGTVRTISSSPRNGGNAELWKVGAGYGAIKLPSDPPHWSDDGR